MNPYIKLLSRKRTWTPVQTSKGKLKEGAEETIYRALQYAIWSYQLASSLQKHLIRKFPTLPEHF